MCPRRAIEQRRGGDADAARVQQHEVQGGHEHGRDDELAHARRGGEQGPERHAAEHHEHEHGELARDADVQRGEAQQREDEQRPRRAPAAGEGGDRQRAQCRHAHAGPGDDRERERGVHGEPGHGGQERRGRQDRRPRVGDAKSHPPRTPRQDYGEPLGHRERGARRDVDCSVSVEESRHRTRASRATRAGAPPKGHVRAHPPRVYARWCVPRRHAVHARRLAVRRPGTSKG